MTLNIHQNPEPQKPLSQPALAAAGEVGGRIPAVGHVPGRVNEGDASPNPTRGGAFEARDDRGTELLAEHDRLDADRPALRVWLQGLDQGESRDLAYELGKRCIAKLNEKKT